MSQYAQELTRFVPKPEDLKKFAESDQGTRLVGGFDHCLLWTRLLGDTYAGYPGEVLLHAAHSKILEMWALVPLGLLHSACGCLRTIIDLAIGFSYYVFHGKEWYAVCASRSDWMGRAAILEWHIDFTARFRQYNKAFGVSQYLDEDYRILSNFIHGVPPQGLPTMKSLSQHSCSQEDIERVIDLVTRVDGHINLFLVGVFPDIIVSLSPDEYRLALSGLDRRKLAACGLTLPAR